MEEEEIEMPDAIYKALVEHLNEMPIKAPMSDEFMEILKILFVPEEAELAVKLPFSNSTLGELSVATGMPEDRLEGTLDTMASRGTVFKMTRKGVTKYRLLPPMVGFSETPFWPGKDNEKVRKLSPLWTKYLYGSWGKEIADRKIPLLRAIPVREEVGPSSQVLPYETVKEVVEKLDYRAVAYCPCRQIKAYTGEGCDHERENCFHFGSMGRYIVEQGMGRELTLEETLRKLEEAHEEGLVFSADNYQGKVSTLCCCCSCCCVFLQSRNVMGLENAMAPSVYAAAVDGEQCLGCGTCEERCPVGAIALDDGETAQVKEGACLGCGVCIPTCSGDAITLRRREAAAGVPTLEEFITGQIQG
jgi:electron transport complex protein RnfB